MEASTRSSSPRGWAVRQGWRSLRRALVLSEKLASDFPAVPLYRFGLALGRTSLARLLNETGRPCEAEAMLRLAMPLYEKLMAECPAVRRSR